MNELRIKEVILCETGCGRIAGECGFCSRCLIGIEEQPLNGLWNFVEHRRPTRGEVIQAQSKPDMPDWVYRLLGMATMGLSCWLVFEFIKMFAVWLMNGGRPWQ
jgi:hypothetical protein